MGYIAYIITGGVGSVQRFREVTGTRFVYATLAYEYGDGPLFDLIRTAFDPGPGNPPTIRRGVVAGNDTSEDWIDPSDVPEAVARLFRTESQALF